MKRFYLCMIACLMVTGTMIGAIACCWEEEEKVEMYKGVVIGKDGTEEVKGLEEVEFFTNECSSLWEKSEVIFEENGEYCFVYKIDIWNYYQGKVYRLITTQSTDKKGGYWYKGTLLNVRNK